MAVDIVCGKEIGEEGVSRPVGHVAAGAPETDPTLGTKRLYQGKWFYFCSLGCRQKFLATPDEHIARWEASHGA